MKNSPARGRFITLEGIEGTGKSSQLHFIGNYLQKKAIPFVITREPGGTLLAEAIRQLVLEPRSDQEKIIPESELLLFFAARVQHIHYVIRPALARGDWVVCDRFTETSYAYQGGGRGIDGTFIRFLEQWLQKDLSVDAILLFHAAVEVTEHRVQTRNRCDRIEVEKQDFFNRVQATYLKRAEQMVNNYYLIDANLSRAEVENQLRPVLDKLISLWWKSNG